MEARTRSKLSLEDKAIEELEAVLDRIQDDNDNFLSDFSGDDDDENAEYYKLIQSLNTANALVSARGDARGAARPPTHLPLNSAPH